MALINCPECSKEISDKATTCPQCGCPINNKQNSTFTHTLPSMLWDSEDETYICVKCPRCNKEAKIRKTTASKTSNGYSLSGEGNCSCGLTFDTISYDKSKNYGICSDCGVMLDNDRGFCSKCGGIQINKSDKYISTNKPTVRKSGGRFKYFLWIVGVLLLVGMCSKQNNTSSTNSGPTTTSSIPEKASPVATSTNSSNMKSANNIMTNVKSLANVYEEGSHLVVEFNTYLYPDDINKRLQFIRAVADADYIITGKTRSIFYYNPGGTLIGKADSTNGVKLR